MAIPLFGQTSGGPFNRTYFNVRLPELVRESGAPDTAKVTLYLSDGLRLGLCHIEELSDDYLVVRGYRDEPGCDLSVHVIPYGLIYRMEIDPTGGSEPRMGFRGGDAPSS